MRGANGQLLGGSKFGLLGMDGGGWVTGIDIADDGTMVTRNDTNGAHIRSDGDSEWTELFRIGQTFSESLSIFKGPAGLCYDACIAPINSHVVYAVTRGYLWKSVNRGASLTKLAGYKGGKPDFTMSFGNVGNARIGGQHMRVDPAGTDVVGFGHPVDGLYYTTNGGGTWIKHPDIPAPGTAIGICLIFDRASPVINGQTQTVYAVVTGHGTYRSQNGISGSFIHVAGGPLVASSLAMSNNQLCIIGNGAGDDSQLSIWDGKAWRQPAGISGMAVAVNPSVPNYILAMAIGGAIHVSSDGGQNWSGLPSLGPTIAEDVPWLGWTKADWFALGAMVFHPRNNSLIATNGIGVFAMDGLPNNDSKAKPFWRSITKGIRQLLPMDVVAAPNGRVHVAVQDRGVFSFDRDRCEIQASRHGPDNTVVLRHGTSVDFAIDDPNYLVSTYSGAGSITHSKDGGRTWHPLPSVPTFAHATEGTVPFYAGNVSVSNVGNIVWVSTANGGVRTTRDGGETWVKPSFAGADVTGAFWHNAYYLRRRVVAADKMMPGHFYLFCVGTGKDDSADWAMRGLWKSEDGGINFRRVNNWLFSVFGSDFWHGKLRLVPGQLNHLVWCVGEQNNYPTPPSAIGLFFSVNGGKSNRMLPGWAEPEDIAFGKPAAGAAYPAIYVVGWRGGKHGLWRCIDFNPENLKGTWENLSSWPLGREDLSITLAADMTRFGRVYYALGGGGVAYADYDYHMKLV